LRSTLAGAADQLRRAHFAKREFLGSNHVQ
jgi:hypothetical protein